jgi:hypothetical protein
VENVTLVETGGLGRNFDSWVDNKLKSWCSLIPLARVGSGHGKIQISSQLIELTDVLCGSSTEKLNDDQPVTGSGYAPRDTMVSSCRTSSLPGRTRSGGRGWTHRQAIASKEKGVCREMSGAAVTFEPQAPSMTSVYWRCSVGDTRQR